jgi:cytochrome P450
MASTVTKEDAAPLSKPGTPRLAPGPKGLPFLGVLPEFMLNPTRMLVRAAKMGPDIVRLKFGPFDSYLVIEPDLVKRVLQDNIQNYCRGRIYERFKIFFGVGLLTLEGETWLYHRRVTQPQFHQEHLNSLVGTMTECTGDMLDHWQAKQRNNQPVDLEEEMLRLSLRMLLKSFLGTDIQDPEYTELRPHLKAVVEKTTRHQWFAPVIDLLPKQIPLPTTRSSHQIQLALQNWVNGMIKAHRQEGAAYNDYISILLDARDRKTGEPLTDYQIYDEIRTLILAGYETVGSGAAWSLYALSQHPAVLRQLEDELDRALGGRTPRVEDLAKLPYLQMVINESLRVYPPIWAYPRDAISQDVLGDCHIPAKSMVLLSPYVTHHSPKVWENPEAFDPERFTPENSANRPRFAFYPFGGGQRQCIGSRYALMQMQVVVAMVVQQYRLHQIPGHPVEFSTLNTLHPKDGIMMSLHTR